MAENATMLGALALLGARWQAPSATGCAGGLDERSRQLVFTTPSARIPLATGLGIWGSLPDDPHGRPTAVEIARQAPLSALQLLESASSSAPHLLGAIQVFCHYSAYLWSGEPLSEHIGGGVMTVTWDEPAGSVPTSLRDFTFARIAVLLDTLGVRRVRPDSVALAGPTPPHGVRACYEEAFGCPVDFGESPSAIVLRTSDLSTALYGSNPALHTSVTQRLGAFRGSGGSATARVVGTLEHLLERGDARIDVVAARLGMSRRSLQKALAAEGYRFSELLRQVRHRRAIRLLAETEAPITTVASALGYTSVASFSRAFVHWHGCSPASYRLQLAGT